MNMDLKRQEPRSGRLTILMKENDLEEFRRIAEKHQVSACFLGMRILTDFIKDEKNKGVMR
jgi:hypothetical protein